MNCGGAGVFTQATALSVPLEWALTSTNPEAQRRCVPTLHALIFSSCIGAAIHQCVYHIDLGKVSASGISVKDEIDRAVNSNPRDHWLSLKKLEHAGSAIRRRFTGSWHRLTTVLSGFLAATRWLSLVSTPLYTSVLRRIMFHLFTVAEWKECTTRTHGVLVSSSGKLQWQWQGRPPTSETWHICIS